MDAQAVSIYLATMEWFKYLIYFVLFAIFIVLAGGVMRRFSGVIEYTGIQLQRGGALANGVGLILLSGAINSTFALYLLQMFPQYAEFENVAALALGLVNLSAIWVAVAIKKARDRGAEKPEILRLYAGWTLIVVTSMVTASTMMSTGNERMKRMDSLADDYVALANDKVKNNNQIIKAPAVQNADAARLGRVITTNFNGDNVTISNVCKAGGWYDRNRPSCRRYLAALKSSGQAARNANLRQQNITIREGALKRKEDAPVPFQASLGPIIIPFSIVIILMSLVIEVAAGLSLSQAMHMGALAESVRGAGTSSPSVPKSGSGTGNSSKNNGSRRVTVPDKNNGSVVPPTKNKESKSVNNGSQISGNQHTNTELAGVKSAYLNSIGTGAADKIDDRKLEDFIFQLAVENPHKRVTVNGVISALKSQRITASNPNGTAVKKERVVEALNSPELSDVIIIGGDSTKRHFTFRRFNKGEQKTELSGSAGRSGMDGSGRSQTANIREAEERTSHSA